MKVLGGRSQRDVVFSIKNGILVNLQQIQVIIMTVMMMTLNHREMVVKRLREERKTKGERLLDPNNQKHQITKDIMHRIISIIIKE